MKTPTKVQKSSCVEMNARVVGSVKSAPNDNPGLTSWKPTVVLTGAGVTDIDPDTTKRHW
jgi:hypothetical protein